MDEAVTIVSYYAPNKQPTPFLTHLMQVITTHKIGIATYDDCTNQILHPFLDKSPYHLNQTSNKISFSQLLSKHELVDTWREINPTKKGFKYYSHPHQTFSCIDHIFLTTGMTPEVLTSDKIPIAWSDLNGVLTSIASIIPKAQVPTWYLPDKLLNYPSHRLTIEHAQTEYLTHNKNPDISPMTLWEAHKPVMRGIIQSQSAAI